MIRVRCSDGAVFAAPTAADVIRAMQRDAWLLQHVPKTTYMRDVQRRVADVTGTTIRLRPALFLADLEALGFLTLTQDVGADGN